jgi:hypothetical protein
MSRNLADYYHWEEADRGIRIYMHSGMADRLQAEIPGELEAGGILLGRVEQDRGKPVVVIDDFVPVPCAHRTGPRYDLSDEDRVKLEEALLRAALAGCDAPDAPSTVGYYRSHLRDGLWLSVADLETIDGYFQAPDSVFLLVKAVAGVKACTAGFFFWEDGRIQSEFSSLEVALGSTPSPAPPSGQPAMLESAPDAAGDSDGDLPNDLAELFRKAALPHPYSAPDAEATPEQPGHIAYAWPRLILRGATILLASVALAVSVVTYLGSPRPPRQEAAAAPSPVSTLGLHAERTPPDLLLIWNRNAREIMAARRGTLTIRDGRRQKTWDLDKAHLSLGSHLYTPVTENIQCRLEVYAADDGSVAQSIRVK